MSSTEYFEQVASRWDRMRESFFGDAVAEMVGILRRGGRLAISELDHHDHAWLLVEHENRWPGFERSQLVAWLSQAGPVDAGVSDTRSTCRASSDVAPARAEVSIFVAYGRRAATSP